MTRVRFPLPAPITYTFEPRTARRSGHYYRRTACPGVPLIQTQRRSSREPVKHPFRSGADYWNGATQGIWIMSAGQPTNDELEARQVRFDNLQAHRERATNSAWATAGWDDTPESLGRIDQITLIPKATSAGSHDIKIDESHRLLVSTGFHDGLGVRVGLFAAALVASTGLTWLVINALPSPFASASVGGSIGSLNTSAHISDSRKGDRLQIRSTINRETDRQAPAQAPDSPNLSSSSASSHAKPSLRVAPAAFASKHSTDAQQHTTPITAGAGDLQTQAKLTPTPETRPTTIAGWTLREVTNGTAVLEGPNGTWRAARRDTVPGAGRVDSIFRWGNRWIVATSSGLISTP